MPYKLRKAPKRDLYWVVAEDGTKKSKDPLPLERAKAQMRALYANVPDARGGAFPFQMNADRMKILPAPAYTAEQLFPHRKYNEIIYPSPLNPKKELMIEGSGFLGDLWDSAKSEWKDKGAATITRTNYVGPWNRLDDEYIRTHPPTDIIDRGAMEHDLEYSRIAKLRKEGKTPPDEIERMIRVSDEKFLKNIRDNWKANPWASALGYSGIKGKNIVEDTTGLDKNLFVGEGKKGGIIIKSRPQDQPYYKEPVKYGRPQDTMPILGYGGKDEEDEMDKWLKPLRKKKLKGEGFFGDIWEGAKNVVHRVVKGVKDVSMGFRNDYPPSVRGLLGHIGDKPIVQMFVRRDPIQSALNTALNFISIGKWNQVRDKYGFDKFFHLRLEVIVKVAEADNILGRYTLEKNEVINIVRAIPIEADTEIMPVQMDAGLTVNDLLNGAKQIQGDNLHKYDAFGNNCQDFVRSMLLSNGLLTPELQDFIKQNITQAISELPSWTGKIARGITDLGAIANVGLEGRGGLHPRAKFAKQLAKAGVKPDDYLALARKKAIALGLVANHIGFSDDDKHKLQIPNAEGQLVRFGSVGLGDYILYSLARNPEAKQHQKRYLARATKIRGDWKDDPYSANSLAIGVLW